MKKKPKTWIDYQKEQAIKQIKENCEKLFYSAQEGSTLDLIWKSKHSKTKKL